MKIATWNVNSLRVRLPHLLDWLDQQPVDVVGIQETKLTEDAFPFAELEAAGLHAVHNGQKTYNGVALVARQPLQDVSRDIPGFNDEQKRVIAATVGDVRVVNVYVVNGQAVGSEKYAYKLRWLAALHDYLAEEIKRYPLLAVTGDFNIAPAPEDTHDPAVWEGQILCSDPEREALQRLLALGLQDSFRLFDQPDKSFTWWDYRQAGFRRNLGLRIDHILLSAPLAARCTGCAIDLAPRRLERPSDHAPLVAELAATAT
ncbi:exodeoxyribonuclease III [Sinimarinibacterium sp. CAU 1509]|uniref:exodeoxyribonuclease III n=1 Tax=Sinimarinibacterium sp. CAU 1509 TaxID=2562283 RepID=UPI0010AD691F|nr:exodeoxyribonuclease III [Sinimarinibacterium sp. CAU 1509]TJY56753.1 exodeoxyribonuclease III [Sinimarinibacterium sp. CAU 1509]